MCHVVSGPAADSWKRGEVTALCCESQRSFHTEPAWQVKMQTKCAQKSYPCAIKYLSNALYLVWSVFIKKIPRWFSDILLAQLRLHSLKIFEKLHKQATWCEEWTLLADLIKSLDHPFVPVVEHVQPLHLPLPEHLWRHILSSGDTREKTQHRHISYIAL